MRNHLRRLGAFVAVLTLASVGVMGTASAAASHEEGPYGGHSKARGLLRGTLDDIFAGFGEDW
ncbi:hypothetical protein [Streptomyces gilvosporeus]|nr:hypothetical protein [Streptomyces gilvosporeus]